MPTTLGRESWDEHYNTSPVFTEAAQLCAVGLNWGSVELTAARGRGNNVRRMSYQDEAASEKVSLKWPLGSPLRRAGVVWAAVLRQTQSRWDFPAFKNTGFWLGLQNGLHLFRGSKAQNHVSFYLLERPGENYLLIPGTAYSPHLFWFLPPSSNFSGVGCKRVQTSAQGVNSYYLLSDFVRNCCLQLILWESLPEISGAGLTSSCCGSESACIVIFPSWSLEASTEPSPLWP